MLQGPHLLVFSWHLSPSLTLALSFHAFWGLCGISSAKGCPETPPPFCHTTNPVAGWPHCSDEGLKTQVHRSRDTLVCSCKGGIDEYSRVWGISSSWFLLPHAALCQHRGSRVQRGSDRVGGAALGLWGNETYHRGMGAQPSHGVPNKRSPSPHKRIGQEIPAFLETRHREC